MMSSSTGRGGNSSIGCISITSTHSACSQPVIVLLLLVEAYMPAMEGKKKAEKNEAFSLSQNNAAVVVVVVVLSHFRHLNE